MHIPIRILVNSEYLTAYLRGLFDTDGSFYIRRKKDKVVSFIARDKDFLEEIANALRVLGYYPTVSGKNLYIYRQSDIRRFFEQIRPKYPKHTDRYKNVHKQINL